MSEASDAQLLREYVQRGNEAAFREIVVRHTDAVYSAALRQVISPDLARDVAQIHCKKPSSARRSPSRSEREFTKRIKRRFHGPSSGHSSNNRSRSRNKSSN